MNSARVTATAHTGVTVSDIDRSIAFYRDVLGFEVTDKIEVGGELFERVTGVPKAEIVIAYVKAPGHTVELLQYTSPADRTRVTSRSCDSGARHSAFRVKNIDDVIAVCRQAGVIPGQSDDLGTRRRAGQGPEGGLHHGSGWDRD